MKGQVLVNCDRGSVLLGRSDIDRERYFFGFCESGTLCSSKGLLKCPVSIFLNGRDLFQVSIRCIGVQRLSMTRFCNTAFDNLLIPLYSAEESHSVSIFSCVIILNRVLSMTHSEPIPACLFVISG